MAEQTTQPGAATESKLALVCRLRHKIGRNGSSPTAGEIELENVSEQLIEIEISIHPLQYLHFIITDAEGSPVHARPYGNIFSPREQPCTFRLAPGEEYRHNVSLLGNLPEENQRPGIYTVRAVYEYNGLTSVSEPLDVQLP